MLLLRGDHERALPHVTLRFRSATKTYETRTDESGVYAFSRLPAGTYRVSAELPPDLILDVPFFDEHLAERAGKEPAPLFELAPKSCGSYDVFARQTGPTKDVTLKR
jgi:hypothetical protein